MAGDADDGTGTYDERDDAQHVRHDSLTEHRGTGQGAVVYHRQDNSERQDYVNPTDSRHQNHSRSGYTSIEDRTGDQPAGGDGFWSAAESSGIEDQHRSSGWGELSDHGYLDEFSYVHGWGSDVFWGGIDSLRTWDNRHSFEQHTPLDVDSRRDVSESWRGPLQDDYSRSGSQRFDGTRSGPWQLHDETWEHIDAPSLYGPDTRHVSDFTQDRIVIGNVVTGAEESATLTPDGFVIDSGSTGNRLVRTDEWAARDWTWGDVYTPPSSILTFAGWLTKMSYERDRYHRTDLDHDQPTYGPAGATSGSSRHEVFETSVHDGGSEETGIEAGYNFIPFDQSYFIRDPYTLKRSTQFVINTYHYVEDGSFVPADKKLSYHSGKNHASSSYTSTYYDKANRIVDGGGAPPFSFDSHNSGTTSQSSSGGYSEVGYYPQWNNPSASASAQQQAQQEQEAEGDPPLLHWDRTYFDPRPPEHVDTQLLVPEAPLPQPDGAVRDNPVELPTTTQVDLTAKPKLPEAALDTLIFIGDFEDLYAHYFFAPANALTEKTKTLSHSVANEYDGPLPRAYVVVGTVLGEYVGVTPLSDAFEGDDAFTAEKLDRFERLLRGAQGSVQLFATAEGIALVGRGIRISGAANADTQFARVPNVPSSNVTGPFGIRTLGAAEAKLPSLPSNARTAGIDDVYRRLQQYHGIDAATASERLHLGKQALGYGASDNLLFDLTGNVFDPVTREWLFSLTRP